MNERVMVCEARGIISEASEAVEFVFTNTGSKVLRAELFYSRPQL